MRDHSWLCLLPFLTGCSFDSSAPGAGGVLGGAGDADAAHADLLLLAAAGTYAYDTDEGVLRHEGGPPIPHASDMTAEGRRVTAGRIVIGADVVLRVTGSPP